MEKAMEFAERIKKVQEEARAALKRAQKKMKQQANRERKKTKVWKVRDKVMYKRFNVQEATSKEISRSICWSIHHQ